VGLVEGALRQTLEETGMGFGLEVDMIRAAHELGLLTVPYVFDDDQARAMAEAGADILVPHMGTTAKGAIGARTTPDMEDSARRITSMARAALEVNPDILVFCHGGPIAEPSDAAEIMRLVPEVVGFLGASSTERLPVERAIADTVREFKSIRVGQGARS
jgi:predicted TIM-barrel enzyme